MAVAVSVPTVSVVGNGLLDLIRATNITSLLQAGAAAGVAGALAWLLHRVWQLGQRRVWLTAAAGLSAIGGVLYGLPIGPRWMHVALFTPLGLSCQRALGTWTALAACAALAGADEMLQAILADRTGSVVDALANAVSAVGGIALGWSSQPQRGPAHRVGHTTADGRRCLDDQTTGTAMANYTLYGISASTYVRSVRMVLHEKGIAYKQVPVDILQGEGRSAEHRKRHPFGKVPTLTADGVNLFESQAIAELIEHHHPMPPLIPTNGAERAKMRQWMSVIDNYTYPQVVATIVWQRLVNPALGKAADEAVVRGALPDAELHFGLFDEALGASKFLAGGELTLADLYLAPIVAYLADTPEGERLLESHLYVADWYNDIRQRESFRTTTPG